MSKKIKERNDENMAVINMVNNLKELFPNYVLLLKIGTFYECYNDDANIISYLFGYKIRNVPANNKSCGFPIASYNKIISNPENRNINYIIIDKVHNYEEVDKVNYKNNYKNILIKANNYIDIINRIDKIKKYLLKDNTKLEEVENILYER